MSSPRRTRYTDSQNATDDRTESDIQALHPPVVSRRLSRPILVTPRNSIAEEALTAAAKETPYETLRQLANIAPKPSTPVRRASSAGPPSTRRSNRQTPGALDKTPAGVSHPASARRVTALTPHARAAFRENEIRRAAALTPGKDRRRSGRQQRETPRDVLRALSRVLAVDTRPQELTPKMGDQLRKRPTVGRVEDVDDGSDPIRPRLSMPLGEDDEDDSFLLPPQRSEGFEDDENFTQRSIELPRRAISEQPGGRLSKGSFENVRTSGQFGDLTQLGLSGLDADEYGSSFIGQGNFDDEPILEADPTLPRDAIGDINRSYLDGFGRRSLESRRASYVRPQDGLADDTEMSFVFAVPKMESVPGRESLNEQVESENDDDEQAHRLNAPFDVENPGEHELQHSALYGDLGAHIPVQTIRNKPGRVAKKKKALQLSKYGIQYPSLPPGVVKNLAITYLRTSGNNKAKISKDTLEAIMRATDWFFEQVSDDLSAYAEHAGRKTIDENDVLTLMQRQRQTNTTATPFALAQKYLPRELLQDLRMAPPSKIHRGIQLERLKEDDEEE